MSAKRPKNEKKSTNKKNDNFRATQSMFGTMAFSKLDKIKSSSQGDSYFQENKPKAKVQKYRTKVDLIKTDKPNPVFLNTPQKSGKKSSMNTLFNQMLNVGKDSINSIKLKKSLSPRDAEKLDASINALLNQITNMEQQIDKKVAKSKTNKVKLTTKSPSVQKPTTKKSKDTNKPRTKFTKPKTAKAEILFDSKNVTFKNRLSKPLTAPAIMSKKSLNDMLKFAETMNFGKKLVSRTKNMGFCNIEDLSRAQQSLNHGNKLKTQPSISKKVQHYLDKKLPLPKATIKPVKINSISTTVQQITCCQMESKPKKIYPSKEKTNFNISPKEKPNKGVRLSRQEMFKCLQASKDNSSDNYNTSSPSSKNTLKIEIPLSMNNENYCKEETCDFRERVKKFSTIKREIKTENIAEEESELKVPCSDTNPTKELQQTNTAKKIKLKNLDVTTVVTGPLFDCVPPERVDEKTSTTVLLTLTDEETNTNEVIGINSETRKLSLGALSSSKLFSDPTNLIEKSILAVEDILKTINNISNELNDFNDENLEEIVVKSPLDETIYIKNKLMSSGEIVSHRVTINKPVKIPELVKKIKDNLKETSLPTVSPKISAKTAANITPQLPKLKKNQKVSLKCNTETSTSQENFFDRSSKNTRILRASGSEKNKDLNCQSGNLLWIKKPCENPYQSERNLINKEKKENCINNLEQLVKPKRRINKKKILRPQSAKCYIQRKDYKPNEERCSKDKHSVKKVLDSLRARTNCTFGYTNQEMFYNSITEDSFGVKKLFSKEKFNIISSQEEDVDWDLIKKYQEKFKVSSKIPSDTRTSIDSLQFRKCILRNKYSDLFSKNIDKKCSTFDRCREILSKKFSPFILNSTTDEIKNRNFETGWIATNEDYNCFKNKNFLLDTDSTSTSCNNFIVN